MMRSLSTLAAVILWSALSHIAVADDRPAGVPEEAKWVKVDRVVDGDTIVLMDKTRVRLHWIDTPERDQPYGKQATSALDALIETKVFVTVGLNVMVIAQIFTGQIDLSIIQ